MIAIRGVTKVYGKTPALTGVDLEIGRGECLAIAGSRGSGRTTLLRIMATLVRPTSGRVAIDGIDIASDVFRVRPLVAYAGRDPIDGNRLRVDEYLRFVATARKQPASSVEPIAALVGLDVRAPIAALAADVQSRLALAAALIAAPAVLLLDEPLGVLESAARAGFLQWLADARRRGATIVMSASAGDDVSEVCPRVVRLDAGRVIEIAAGQPLPAAPAELVGA